MSQADISFQRSKLYLIMQNEIRLLRENMTLILQSVNEIETLKDLKDFKKLSTELRKYEGAE